MHAHSFSLLLAVHHQVGMHFMHPVVSDSPGVELGVELSKGMHTRCAGTAVNIEQPCLLQGTQHAAWQESQQAEGTSA